MGIKRYGQSLNVFFSKLTFCHLSPFSTDPFNYTVPVKLENYRADPLCGLCMRPENVILQLIYFICKLIVA